MRLRWPSFFGLFVAPLLQCFFFVAGRGLRATQDPSDKPLYPGDVATQRKQAKCSGGAVERWQIHAHHKCPGTDQDRWEGRDGLPVIAAKLGLGKQSAQRRAADERLLDRVKSHMSSDDSMSQRALNLVQRVVGFRAWEVFALQETWTDDDTEILRGLDDVDSGFTQGNLSTQAFAARLPRRADLSKLLEQRRLAVVGSGATLENATTGSAIDSHAQVARFNGLTGSKLVPADTGNKTTIHVMNHGQKPLEDASVAGFDLEWTHPWSSYCQRMHRGGDFKSRGPLFLIRPSVYCALGDGFEEFTRGFLFYWFVGREFEQIDMYGFKGHSHYKTLNDAYGVSEAVGEKFLAFEHLLYEQLAALKPSMAYI